MQDDVAKTAAEWVFVARSVAQLPSGQEQALRCMARAGMAAQDVADWLTVGTAWEQDFNDPTMAREGVAKAECLVEDAGEWEQIAELWTSMGCFSKAVECYEKFFDKQYEFASDPETASISMASKARSRISQDYMVAIRIMVMAEALAKNSNAQIEIAGTWKEGFQDRASAIRCLSKAEEVAEHSEDWLRMAKIWKEELQDIEEAIRCMEQAEEVAGYFEDYSAIEETWRTDFQEVDRDIVNNAIQRLVDAADAEFGLTEIIDSAFGSQGSNQVSLVSETEVTKADESPMGIADLGYLTPGAVFTQPGIWNSQCYSVHRPDCYARRYAFKVAMPLVVLIDLSSEVDTYLYLLDADGTVLDENDDWQDGTDSRIERHLAAGTYTIEATTFSEEESGEFSLAINT